MKHYKHHLDDSPQRSGFTLVELMVSVTLVLLMMTLFTAIFSMATESVTRQKGIAELDGRARLLTTNIKADGAKRTFRYAMPFYPGEDADTTPTSFGKRSGYIYISVNDPTSGTDDLLQFTVDAGLLQENIDDSLYYGAGALLYDQLAEVNGEPRTTALRYNPNQPEADDGVLNPNGVTGSTAAEVSYFIRNGKLIRRVMLLRDPLAVTGDNLATEPRSTAGDNPLLLTEVDMTTPDTGGRFWYVGSPGAITEDSGTGPGNFRMGATETAAGDRPTWNVTQSNDLWRYFDVSAVPIPATAGSNFTEGATLVGTDNLANDSGLTSLGNPSMRWGFNFFRAPSGSPRVLAQSREHTSAATPLFLGRFLQAETSDYRFNWPMSNSAADVPPTSSTAQVYGAPVSNPMDVTNTPLSLQANGVVAEFDGNLAGVGRGASRAVEDQMLANVHEFRVEIWDERLKQFVIPGYGTTSGAMPAVVGDYHIRRCLQADTAGGEFPHGPLAPYVPSAALAVNQQPHVFDTWHPDLSTDGRYGAPGVRTATDLFEVSPPYLPYRFTPPLAPAGPTPALIGNPTGNEIATVRSFRNGMARNIRCTNQGYWQPTVAYNLNDVVFVPWIEPPLPPPDGLFTYDEVAEPKFHIAYRCVTAGTTPATPPPVWPKTPGQVVTDGAVQWEAIDNRQPLKSIRIVLRFQEPNTETLRQLTLLLPMTVDEN